MAYSLLKTDFAHILNAGCQSFDFLRSLLRKSEQLNHRNTKHFRNKRKLNVRDESFSALNTLNRVLVQIQPMKLQLQF